MKHVPLIKKFFETLNTRGIEYCHWKSNHLLESFLRGEGDLDILVSEKSKEAFKEALTEFRFKLVVCPEWEQTPEVFHYYGLDEETGKVVHIHLYFQLMTGGMLIKNYHLPLEKLLLKNPNETYGIKIPPRSTELLIFVIRKIIECGSLPDYLFVRREEENIRKEFESLSDPKNCQEARNLLKETLPEFDPALFDECIQTLHNSPHFFNRIEMRNKIARIFSRHAVNSPLRNKRLTWVKFAHVLFQKFIVRKQVYDFSTKGALIAFVGADASGKSTHIGGIEKWLAKMVFVKKIHSGLPPATWLTFIPRLLLPIFRFLLPGQRTNFIEQQRNSGLQDNKNYSIFYLIRSIMIAFDQRNLINKARQESDKGKMVISDRFPSFVLGGMDGLRVDPSYFDKNETFKRFLAGIEKKIYNSISKPDLVFKLSVPLEVNLQRLSERTERMEGGPEKQAQSRRTAMEKWEIPGVPVHDIDNSGSLESVQNKIKSLIWEFL